MQANYQGLDCETMPKILVNCGFSAMRVKSQKAEIFQVGKRNIIKSENDRLTGAMLKLHCPFLLGVPSYTGRIKLTHSLIGDLFSFSQKLSDILRVSRDLL